MTKFRYDGPLASVTIADAGDVVLNPGAEVDLPGDADYVRTLVALGHLTPIASAEPKPAKKKD